MHIKHFEHLENKGYRYIGKTKKNGSIYINNSHLLICTDMMKETWELYDLSNKRKIDNILNL